MSRDSGSSSDVTAPPAFQEAFEPTAASLLDLWMSISDSRSALERSVQVLRRESESPTVAAMETELERMDALIFESIEKADDLFTLIRRDLATRTTTADVGERKMAGTALVDELDAYLDGAFDRLERPLRLSTGTQTVAVEEPTVPPRIPSLYAVQKDASSIEVFDLLSKRVHSMKIGVKTETSDPSSRPWTKKTSSKKGKRRVASPSPQASDSDESMDSGSTKETAKGKRRRATSQIQGRHPQRVCGFRIKSGEEEYGIEYEGIDYLTWVTIHTATKRVTEMIHEYNHARQKKVKDMVSAAQQATSGGEAAASTSGQPLEESEESEPEPLYIVDKIVGHRMRHGRKEYLVKWEGYDSDENTWEPASKLRREVRDVVEEYERQVAEKERRKEAKAQELMRTKAAMQAKVDELSSKMGKPLPASQYPSVKSSRGSRALSDDESDDGEDDSEDSDLDVSSSEDESQPLFL